MDYFIKKSEFRNHNLSRKFISHHIPGSCGYFIFNFMFNSHFLISLQAYKLYYFRYRWSGNCFPSNLNRRKLISPGSGFRRRNRCLISSAGTYPVSKKKSFSFSFLVVPIFSQKFMVFQLKMSNDQKCLIDQKMVIYGQGQNISVLVLSLNIYRFILNRFNIN